MAEGNNSKSNRYYWLKLKRDFFKRHDIRIIESMPNGKDYILFYLKLLCESVDHDGNLRFNEQIPYNEEMLATITGTNVDIVRSAIKVFSQLQMMEILDDGTFYMNEVRKMLGSETKWAEKKRNYREFQKALAQKALEEDKTRTKKDNVRQEKEIDKDIEIDKEKKEKKEEKKKEKKTEQDPEVETIKEIIGYLNARVGANYRANTAETVKLIHGRLKEGRTIDDFKYVIDVKAEEWMGTSQEQYLRPKTLFAQSNFENYLQQRRGVKRQGRDSSAFKREPVDWDELDEWARKQDKVYADINPADTEGGMIIDERGDHEAYQGDHGGIPELQPKEYEGYSRVLDDDPWGFATQRSIGSS